MTRERRILAGALALAVSACGSAPPPPRRALPPPAPVKAVEEDPAAAKAPATIYVYTPIGKRDPFQNVFASREMTPVKIEGRKATPVQKWSLDQLKLSFTMTGTASPLAMVEDPEGRGWTIRIGDFIGKNWGKVTSIQRDQVVVTETITDHSTGRVYPQNIKLQVRLEKAEEADLRALKEGEELAARPQGGQ